MERKNFAVLCAAVLCFWLFALALGTAEGVGLRAVMHPEERAVSANVEEAAEGILLPAAAAAPQLDLNCRAAILIEQGSGRVLYEKNADERVPIASITKVMTLLLAFEAVHDGRLTMETPVPVSEHAYHMGGSEPAFVEQMNARAASLGMEQTSFRNACGLDAEGHLATARDVAAMSRTILNTCPEVLHYTGIWTDTLRGGATQLINTNKLLRRYEGITGLKTGTTGGAGICISASATRNGLSLIAVILGAPSSADRFDAATTLLDYGFGAYEAAPLPKLEAQPLQITVRGSAAGSVPLDYSALPETVLVEKGSGASLHTELTLPEELEAPVEQGQTLGKAAVYQGEALLEEYEVRAASDAPRMTVRDAIGLLWQSLTGAA